MDKEVKHKELNLDEKQKVSYCIPLWLRDEQIRQAITRVPGRIQPGDERDEPIAIVGFGPSLNDTWEQVKDFKYIISCSGSHKFLIERGIIPTWHVEVDPRPHKVELIGPPQKEVEYLIASTCSPKVFDHLEGYNVKLWHVFDNSDDGARLLPQGEWAITGGCDVGLRTLTIAAFLGFRDLHIFGIDGCGRESKHAGPHPNALSKFSIVEHEGKKYSSTPGMLAAAQQIWHELDVMPAVKTTFYGEGLIQDMAKTYVRKAVNVNNGFANILAFAKPELISKEMRELNAQLHVTNLAYGVGGGKHAKTVLALANSIKTTSILDYGCGKGYLAKELPFPIWEYDPAIPGKDMAPRPADMVVCTDVLEHIEPDKINRVLEDLRRCMKKLGFFVIHTGPAGKTLPNGQNTHLLQKDKKWWHRKLSKLFAVGKIFEVGPELLIVLAPLEVKAKVKLETNKIEKKATG